jgi:GNAT superfamily N-acetyltransferase
VAARDAEWRAIHQIADRLAPAARRQFLAAYEQLRARIDVGGLSKALASGRVRQVELVADSLPEELQPLVGTLNQGFEQGGATAAQFAGPRIKEHITFRRTMPEAVEAAERNAARLVTNVTRDTKRAIREVVVRGFREQRTVDEMARDIRGLIGLTRADTRAVLNYQRSLRDANVPADDIERKVNALARKKLNARAVTIARTETINSANQGQLALWRQMQKDELIGSGMWKTWIITPDDRLCVRCGALEGQAVPIDKPFEHPDGTVVECPTLHPRCRCAMGLTAAPKAKKKTKTPAAGRGRLIGQVGAALAVQQLLFTGLTGKSGPGWLFHLVTGKTFGQVVSPWLFGSRRLVGMALPFLEGRLNTLFDGRVRSFFALRDDLKAALQAGRWTPKHPSPMWEQGVERPMFTPHSSALVRQGDLLPDPLTYTTQTVDVVTGAAYPEELAKFVIDRLRLGLRIDDIRLTHPLEGAGFAGAWNPRTRTLILSRETTSALGHLMNAWRTRATPTDATDFLAIWNDPLLDARTFRAVSTLVHELLHVVSTAGPIRAIATGLLSPLKISGATRFIEEGVVEYLGRRYAGALLYGREWARYRRIPGLEDTLRLTHGYTEFTREIAWYSETFGSEALERLFLSEFRGEIAVDQIRGWLPHALQTHPARLTPQSIEHLLRKVEQADFREVLEWWQNGTFRRLHELDAETLATTFSTQVVKAPPLLPDLPDVPLEVVRAIDALTQLAALGADTKDIYNAAKNFVAIYRSADPLTVRVLRGTGELLDAAEALISIVDRLTVASRGRSFDESRALVGAIVSVAQAGRQVVAFARGELTGLEQIDSAVRITEAAQKFVKAVRAMTPERAATTLESAARVLQLINPALRGVQAIAQAARAVRVATQFLGDPVAATKRVIAALRGEMFAWDPNQRALAKQSARFWDNLRRGEWKPLDASLAQTARSLIKAPNTPDRVGPLYDDRWLDRTPITGPSIITAHTYDVEQFVWMVADLMGVSWRIANVVLDDTSLFLTGSRAAWYPATRELKLGPKMTPRLKWLMAQVHDPALGTTLLAKGNPEHLLDLHVVVHELMHVTGLPQAAGDPLDTLIVEGLNELYARRVSTALFYGRDNHLHNDKTGTWNGTSATVTTWDRRLMAQAYDAYVDQMKILEDSFGYPTVRAIFLQRDPARRMRGMAQLLRYWVEGALDLRLHAGTITTAEAELILQVVTRLEVRPLLAAMLDQAITVHLPTGDAMISLLQVFLDTRVVGGVIPAIPAPTILNIFLTAHRQVPPFIPGGPLPFPDQVPLRMPDQPRLVGAGQTTRAGARDEAQYQQVYEQQLNTALGLDGAPLATLEQELATLPAEVRAEVVKDAERVAAFAADPLRHLRPFEPPLDPPIFLDSLRPSPRNAKWVEVPFPVLDDDTALRLFQATDVHVGTLEYVPIEQLVATQATVTKSVVYDKLAQPIVPLIPRPGTPLGNVLRPTKNPHEYRVAGGYHLDAVRVIAHEGKYYVTDGTHRSVAAWARGDKNVWAFVSRPTKPVSITRDIRPSERPIRSPFEGERPGEHTPALQAKLIDYLTTRTGEQFRAHGSVAQGVTSTHDVDIIRLPPTHGLTREQIQAYWAEQTRLARVAEDEARALFDADIAAGVPREDAQRRALARYLVDDTPTLDPVTEALLDLGFTEARVVEWAADGQVFTGRPEFRVRRFEHPLTGHAIDVFESALADEPPDWLDGVLSFPDKPDDPVEALRRIAGAHTELPAGQFFTAVQPGALDFPPGLFPHDAFRVLPESVVRGVPLADLVATQASVFVEGVAKHLPLKPDALVLEPLPVLIEWQGRLFVSNGHHRIVAARLRGETTIDAHVLRPVPLSPSAVDVRLDTLRLAQLPDLPNPVAREPYGIGVSRTIPEQVDLRAVWHVQVDRPPYHARAAHQPGLRTVLQPTELRTLVATQPGALRSTVSRFLAAMPENVPLPTVVEFDGVRYIDDGHHRLLAAQLSQQPIAVNLIVVPQEIPEPVRARALARLEQWPDAEDEFGAGEIDIDLLYEGSSDMFAGEVPADFRVVAIAEQRGITPTIETIRPVDLIPDLRPTQPSLSRATLQWAITEAPDSLTQLGRFADERPTLVTYRGAHWILDGHHRLTAAILLDTPISIRRYDLSHLTTAEMEAASQRVLDDDLRAIAEAELRRAHDRLLQIADEEYGGARFPKETRRIPTERFFGSVPDGPVQTGHLVQGELPAPERVVLREGHALVRGVPRAETLTATQAFVTVEGVSGYLQAAEPWPAIGPPHPVLVEMFGQLLVADGHHKIVAALLKGETAILAHVVRPLRPRTESFSFPDRVEPPAPPPDPRRTPATPLEQQTRAAVAQMAELTGRHALPEGFVYSSIDDLLVQHGRFYRSAPLTDAEAAYIAELVRGETFEVKLCYSNSQSLIVNAPPRPGMDLRYHEGVVPVVLAGAAVLPIRHAWLTLNGKVLDVTLRDKGLPPLPTALQTALKDRVAGAFPDTRAYFGVELPLELVEARMLERSEWHTLLDDYERGFPLLRQRYHWPDADIRPSETPAFPDPFDSAEILWRDVDRISGEYKRLRINIGADNPELAHPYRRGFISLANIDPFGEVDRDFLWVDNIRIDPDLRGQGYGRRLYELAFQTAREHGMKGIASHHDRSAAADHAWDALKKRHGIETRLLTPPPTTTGRPMMADFYVADTAPTAAVRELARVKRLIARAKWDDPTHDPYDDLAKSFTEQTGLPVAPGTAEEFKDHVFMHGPELLTFSHIDEVMFHGTSTVHVESILRHGIRPGYRNWKESDRFAVYASWNEFVSARYAPRTTGDYNPIGFRRLRPPSGGDPVVVQFEVPEIGFEYWHPDPDDSTGAYKRDVVPSTAVVGVRRVLPAGGVGPLIPTARILAHLAAGASIAEALTRAEADDPPKDFFGFPDDTRPSETPTPFQIDEFDEEITVFLPGDAAREAEAATLADHLREDDGDGPDPRTQKQYWSVRSPAHVTAYPMTVREGRYLSIGGAHVDEALRRQGLGTALYRRMLAEAEARGFTGLMSQNRSEDADALWDSFRRQPDLLVTEGTHGTLFLTRREPPDPFEDVPAGQHTPEAAGPYAGPAPILHDLSRPTEGIVTLLVELPAVGTIEISNLPLHLFQRHQRGEATPDRAFLWVRTINVRPDVRRQGHGTWLYERALYEAQQRGFTGLASHRGDRNELADAAWASLARRHIVERTADVDRLLALNGPTDVRPAEAGDYFIDAGGALQQVPDPIVTDTRPKIGAAPELTRIRINLPGFGFIEVSNERWLQTPFNKFPDPTLPKKLYDSEFLWVDYIDVEAPYRSHGLGLYLYELAFREAQRRGFKGLASMHSERSNLAGRAWRGVARRHTVEERLVSAGGEFGSTSGAHQQPADFLVKLREPDRKEAIRTLLHETFETKGTLSVADPALVVVDQLRLDRTTVEGQPTPRWLRYRGQTFSSLAAIEKFLLARVVPVTQASLHTNAVAAVTAALAEKYSVVLEVVGEGPVTFESVRRAWVLVREGRTTVRLLPIPASILQPRLLPSTRDYLGDFVYDYEDRTEPGTVFRGITSEEAEHIRATDTIRSTGRYSHPSEGTVFAHDLATAESAVNRGRDNPARTGQATYVIQVRTAGTDIAVATDGFPKLPPGKALSSQRIVKVWMFDASGHVTELPGLPRPSLRPDTASRPLFNPAVREGLAAHERFMAVLTTDLGQLVTPDPTDGLRTNPGLLVEALARAFGVDTTIRALVLDDETLDRAGYDGTWEGTVGRLTLSRSTTQALDELLRLLYVPPGEGPARTPAAVMALLAHAPKYTRAIQVVIHELTHARDTTRWSNRSQERALDEGLTELRSRRLTAALLFGREWRRYKLPTATGPRSYERYALALRWFERTFGTRALENLWPAGPQRVPLVGAALRTWLHEQIDRWPISPHRDLRALPAPDFRLLDEAERARVHLAVDTMSHERLVELLFNGVIPTLDPHRVPAVGLSTNRLRRPADGLARPILNVADLMRWFRQTQATGGDDRRGLRDGWPSVKPSERPPPVYDPDIRYYLERHAEFLRTLAAGEWRPPRGRVATVQGPRYRQVTGVWESIEIPLWTPEGTVTLQRPDDTGHTRIAIVPGTYNVVGLLQLMAWHLGVSDLLWEVVRFADRSNTLSPELPVGLESDQIYGFRSTRTLTTQGRVVPFDRENALAVTKAAELALAGFLWTVRHRGVEAALAVPLFVEALRDAGRALLQLDTNVQRPVDAFDRMLLVGYTEIYIRRFGMPFLYGRRGKLPLPVLAEGRVMGYGAILGPLRWLERRFGRDAALRIWRGNYRKAIVEELLLDWLPVAFARHPDPAVSAAMDELVQLATEDPTTRRWHIEFSGDERLDGSVTDVTARSREEAEAYAWFNYYFRHSMGRFEDATPRDQWLTLRDMNELAGLPYGPTAVFSDEFDTYDDRVRIARFYDLVRRLQSLLDVSVIRTGGPPVFRVTFDALANDVWEGTADSGDDAVRFAVRQRFGLDETLEPRDLNRTRVPEAVLDARRIEIALEMVRFLGDQPNLTLASPDVFEAAVRRAGVDEVRLLVRELFDAILTRRFRDRPLNENAPRVTAVQVGGGGAGWGVLASGLFPLLFAGVWEDLDLGRHDLAWWRRTLTTGRRAD